MEDQQTSWDSPGVPAISFFVSGKSATGCSNDGPGCRSVHELLTIHSPEAGKHPNIFQVYPHCNIYICVYIYVYIYICMTDYKPLTWQVLLWGPWLIVSALSRSSQSDRPSHLGTTGSDWTTMNSTTSSNKGAPKLMGTPPFQRNPRRGFQDNYIYIRYYIYIIDIIYIHILDIIYIY